MIKKIFQVVFTIVILVAWCTLVPEPKKTTTKKLEEPKTAMKTAPESALIQTTSSNKKVNHLMVRTTYYNPVEAQCDSDPLVTADGSEIDLKKLKKGNLKWLAISQDLLPEYPLGTKVKVTSKKYPKISGVYVIHDVMNPRFQYSIDVLSHIDHGHIFGTHLTRIEKV